MLYGEASRLQPDGGLTPGEALLAVESPISEAHVTQRIEDAGEAGREEGAAQVLRMVTNAGVEAQDRP